MASTSGRLYQFSFTFSTFFVMPQHSPHSSSSGFGLVKNEIKDGGDETGCPGDGGTPEIAGHGRGIMKNSLSHQYVMTN